MGAWGVLAFDNDEANDWAYELDGVNDLSVVERAFAKVEESTGRNLEQGTAAEALAACEVLARLRGRPGYTNAYTEKVDRWVAAHPIAPSRDLVARGNAVIDRILGDDSELRELWDEAGDQGWRDAVADLRLRLNG
jgi:hypothetical protein